MNIDIATATTARSKNWKNSTVKWDDLVETLRQPTRTKETYKAYMSMSRDDQQAIKDVGGYVGAYLRNGRRKPHNVGHRQLITLDIDYADADFWSYFTILFSCSAVLHSTHKHSAATPRYRLVVPLDREVTSDEYKAISRRLAGDIGIELFDPTTFQPERLMFWPSCSVDAEYIFEVQSGLPLSADTMLASYTDWRDVTLWPSAKQESDKLLGDVKKQEDPTSKKGNNRGFL